MHNNDKKYIYCALPDLHITGRLLKKTKEGPKGFCFICFLIHNLKFITQEKKPKTVWTIARKK